MYELTNILLFLLPKVGSLNETVSFIIDFKKSGTKLKKGLTNGVLSDQKQKIPQKEASERFIHSLLWKTLFGLERD